MARGDIYYITTKRDDRVSRFEESLFYDQLDRYGLDYVEGRDEEQSKDPLRYLKEELEKMGAAVSEEKKTQFTFSFCFPDLEKARKEYFEPKLEKLKQEAAGLTLDAVIRRTPCLDMILNDTYGDMVMFMDGLSESTVTFDDFIRQLKPDVTCYVLGRTILMH